VIDYVKFAPLPVHDQDRALLFYTEKMGFGVAQDRPYQSGLRWIELTIPGARTRIWFSQRADEAPAEQPSLILMTRDVHATYDALRAKGVAFTQPPSEAPWSPGETFALLRDSEGNLLMLGEARD
jgi:predicted enzyme related to lactoylglutathione lyase